MYTDLAGYPLEFVSFLYGMKTVRIPALCRRRIKHLLDTITIPGMIMSLVSLHQTITNEDFRKSIFKDRLSQSFGISVDTFESIQAFAKICQDDNVPNIETV